MNPWDVRLLLLTRLSFHYNYLQDEVHGVLKPPTAIDS